MENYYTMSFFNLLKEARNGGFARLGGDGVPENSARHGNTYHSLDEARRGFLIYTHPRF